MRLVTKAVCAESLTPLFSIWWHLAKTLGTLCNTQLQPLSENRRLPLTSRGNPGSALTIEPAPTRRKDWLHLCSSCETVLAFAVWVGFPFFFAVVV